MRVNRAVDARGRIEKTDAGLSAARVNWSRQCGRSGRRVWGRGERMRNNRKSLVRQVQEALANGSLGEADRCRLVAELQARVKCLRGKDERFSAVGLSNHVKAMRPHARTA